MDQFDLLALSGATLSAPAQDDSSEQAKVHQALIWLIDDEPAARLTVRRWLTHVGYQVETFEEGSELLSELKSSTQALLSLFVMLICHR